MKKLIYFLTFSLFTIITHAQINLENNYPASTGMTKLTNSGYKYYLMDVTNNQCRLYNTDHSLWKTISLNIPTDQYLYDIKYVSETLFNLDGKVELAFTYYAFDTTNLYYTYTTKVINEDGTELLAIPGGEYLEIRNAETNGTKLLAYVYNYSVYPYTVNTLIYSLPGQLNPGVSDTPDPLGASMNPFPNPSDKLINIPFLLPENMGSGNIMISDSQGHIIGNYLVDQGLSNLQINLRELTPGIYFYKMSWVGGHGGKFIVK